MFSPYLTTQTVDKPTLAPDTAGHHANLLDLFLASCFDQCSAKVLPSLGTSDHSLIYVKLDVNLLISSDVPFHRTILLYNKTSDHTLLMYLSLKTNPLGQIISGFENVIPPKKYQQKPNSQLWFPLECDMALTRNKH